MAQPLIVPNKKLVIPNADQAAKLLQEDFEVIERYVNSNPGSVTRVGVTGNPLLTGDITLLPSGNIRLAEVGQKIVIASSSNPPRSASLFVPGVLTAKTVMVLNIPDPVLTNLDAYFYTSAPAGVTPASCANIQITGSTSGNFVLVMDVATREYHSSSTANVAFEQTNNTSHGTGGQQINFGLFAIEFTPTADLTVESITLNLGAITPPPTGWVRVGFANAVAAGTQVPTTVAALNALWLNDQLGFPAYADEELGNLPLGSSSVVSTFQPIAPVSLTNGTTYTLLIATLSPNKTTLDNTPGVGYSMGNGSAAASSLTGSATLNNTLSPASSGGNWTNNGLPPYPFFIIGGSAIGVTFQGLVTIAITMTGAPANPGTDLNMVMQI